ncbi:alkaline phosphatase D family protein [Corynebacterium bovis]|uniref:alkaline phosphatase D family protein n=2 Tax=Corynebacterium bovis TaxID=36808 RepID=UPI0031386DEF
MTDTPSPADHRDPDHPTTSTGGVGRRSFLIGAAVVGGSTLAARAMPTAAANANPGAAAPAPAGDPGPGPAFVHSVASGDPLADGVIIWTRVTPVPEATPGSGVGAPTRVRWEVATDPQMGGVVRSGEVTATTDNDHTVKVDVRGLQPATTYFYRFTVLDGPARDQRSRTGRTRTAPAPGTRPDRVRFGVCSCSNMESGYFRAYRDMVGRDDLEFVLHLGDYTYEYAAGEYPGLYNTVVRPVAPADRTTSLTDYRVRQGSYHQDPDLADLHAAKPFICIWDDHEFADNVWRDGIAGNSGEPGDNFPAIKAAATRAYFEWMPVRTEGRDDNRHLYRTLRYGDLFELVIPDLRSYRDYELLQSGWPGFLQSDPDMLRSAGRDGRSMMGETQFTWFRDVVTASTAQWQVIANEVMFAPMTLPNTLDPQVADWLVNQVGMPRQGIALNTDQWDGYMAERQKVIETFVETNKRNVVFLTGDIHTSWAADIPRDPAAFRMNQNHDVVATEFVTPSVSAGSAFDTIAKTRELAPLAEGLLGIGQDLLRQVAPWYKWIDLRFHGYMAVEVSADRTHCDWFFTDDVLSPTAPFRHAASFEALRDQPGARPVDAELDRSQTVY